MANNTPEISLYVDDIPMKLNDKYKPLDLSAYLDNEIILPDINELLNDLSFTYNFDRELYTIDVAKHNLSKKKSEMDDTNSKFDKRSIGDKQLDKSALKKSLSNNLNISSKKLIHLNYGEILKPLTKGTNMSDIYKSDNIISNSNNRQKGKQWQTKINPKEFESDTSSPFDNVELQTIDDMQELNSVFSACHKPNDNDINYSPNNVQNHLTSNQFNNINGIHLSGVYGYQFPNTLADNSVKMNYSHIDDENAAQYQSSSLRSSKSASDLPTLFNMEDSLCKKERSHTPPCYSSNKKLNKTKQKLILSDPYDELSQNSKDFVSSISLMGFDRSRVARAVKHIQDDHKKVFDFLLQVQALEEDGYDCSEAEIALHMNNYQILKAKKFLDSLRDLSEAGFNKADIVKALVKCNNDRDKALDILLNSE